MFFCQNLKALSYFTNFINLLLATRTSKLQIIFDMAQANCGKAITKLYNSNAINDNTYSYLMDVHQKGCEAKHEWSSGVSYLLTAANTLHSNNQISDSVKNYIVKINADANKAKHDF